MTKEEANELLAKSIYGFDLKNLKLAYENGADINYDPSLIWFKNESGLEFSAATNDSVLSNSLWNLGMKIVEAEFDEVRQKLEEIAFPVVQFCVEHGIWLNTYYTARRDFTETCFANSTAMGMPT